MKTQHITTILFLALLVSISACKNKANKEPVVSVSILPQKMWIEELTNKQIEVNCLLPTGSNPATYSPGPKQMELLSRSSYYFYIDELGFENAWLPKFKDLNDSTMFINTTAGIVRLQGHIHHGDHVHEASDPHLWVSPKRAKTMLDITYSMLGYSKMFNQAMLDSNFTRLNNKLDYLDSLYTDASKKASQHTFVIYHPALSYIAHDYGFEQISIEKDGQEPTPAHLKQLIDTIKKNGIKYIFIQKQFDKSNAQVIAEESGAQLIEIDPLGYDYFKESEKLANYLKTL